MFKASLIISFYKKIEFLRPVIASLQVQSESDFEVIISDDGSPDHIVTEVKQFLEESGLSYQYLWHEDSGWQKNIILNKSVVASRSELIVFIDADCILHPKFMEQHIVMSKPGSVRGGRRVNLSPSVSKKILNSNPGATYYGWPILFDLFTDSLAKKARDLEQGIYVNNRFIRSFLNDKDRSIKGCNFSICKQDLLAVNGFDERFNQPAYGEDTDLEARLRRNDIQFLGIRNQAIQYHLYHKQLPRPDSNRIIYEENNKLQVTFTPFGINKPG
jgi:glycosyltransferase involved in cell wall biosynthesis